VYAHQHDPDYLLQQLLEIVGYPTREYLPQSGASADQQQVVYETEVNGVRCSVTCSAPVRRTVSSSLSPREREIARLIIRGLPNKTIASVLDISPWTVGTYIKRIFTKLDVNNRAEMVAKLLRDDLLQSAPAEEPKIYHLTFRESVIS
jgi:DNA-binding CsgD family transcriptional regulator